jgi:hypothetical protein
MIMMAKLITMWADVYSSRKSEKNLIETLEVQPELN